MRQFTLLLTCFILCSSSLFAQLGGGPQAQNCAAAINIGAIPYNSPVVGKYTTCGNGNTYTSAMACANTFTNGEDFLFKFTPTAANRCINISLSSYQNNYSGLFVFDGCPDQTATTNCIAQQINRDVSSVPVKTIAINNLQLNPGTTYYIMVSSSSGCYQFDLNLSAGNCTNTLPLSDCFSNVVIPNLPYQDNGQNTCSNRNYLNQGNTKCYGYSFLNGNSKFYKYTPAVNECVKITLKTDSLYSGLFLYKGCPTTPTSSCVTYRTYSYGSLVINTTLQAGETYYIVVNSNPTYTQCINYDLKIDVLDNKGSTCPLAYDFPTTNSSFSDHTIQCKGDEYDVHPGCNTTGTNYMNGDETVYRFEGKKGECIGVTINVKDTYKYAGLYLLNACPSDPAAKCIGYVGRYVYAGTNVLSIEQTLDSTTTYWIVVGTPYTGDYYSFSYDISIRTSGVDTVGVKCSSADVITLPIKDKPVEVSCKGNDYKATDACKSTYMAGNDYVIKFTAPKTQCLKFKGAKPTGPGGIFLTDSCPDAPGASCLASAVVDFVPSDSIGFIYTVQAGKTYFLTIAGINGSTTFGIGLTIDTLPVTDACNYCNTNVCIACTNVGFERMDFAGWTGFTGTVANPSTSTGLNEGPINNGSTRHTIMSNGSYDPMAGTELPVVSPRGGNFAVRLGNKLTGAEGEMLTYDFTVDESTKNFFYYYAVVFQDPGTSHTEAEKPYFRVRMFDQSGIEIQCAHYEVRAGPSIPGFQDTPYDTQGIWKNWTLVAVPLDSYVGQRVKIEFTTLDCSQSGHYGYAYVDGFCGDLGILSSKAGLCPGETVTLTAPEGFASYQWSTGATSQSITVGATGNYSVVLTPFSSGTLATCNVTLSYQVNVYEQPSGNITFDLGCADSLVTVKGTGLPGGNNPISGYEWDFGDGSGGTGQQVIHGFPGPGTYNVTLTLKTEKGCDKSITASVTIDPFPELPEINATDTIHLCEKQNAQFYGDDLANVTWKWTGPNGFNSNIRNPLKNNVTLADTGMYYVDIQSTTDECLKRRDSTYLKLDAFPDFKIIKDSTICFKDTLVKLWVRGGENYIWSTASASNLGTLDTLIATVKDKSTFNAQILNTLCPDSNLSVTINVDKPIQALSVSDDIRVCVNDPFQFSASANPSRFMKWTGPSSFVSSDSIINKAAATPPMEGFYKVKAYLGANQYCLFGEDSVFVDVLLPPNLSITPSNPSLCPGDSVLLTANGATVYTWSYDNFIEFASGNTVTYKPGETGIIINKGVDNDGCESTKNATIVVKPQFQPNLGPDRNLCKGEIYTVSLNTAEFHKPPSSVLWSTGASGNSINVSSSGTYWARVTIDGCVKSDTIIIDFQDPADFNLGPDPLLCQNQNHTLDVRAYGTQVTWEDGSTNPVRNISYPGGTYYVDIINGKCVLTDTITVQYQDLHAVDLGPDKNICLGTSVTLNTQHAGQSHQWTDGVNTSTADTLVINSSGLHNVNVTVTIGVCSASDAAIIMVEAPPIPNLGPDTTVCEDKSVSLSPKILGANSYLWNDGSIAPVLTANTAGLYHVQVTKGACTVYDTIMVNHDLIPVFDLGPDQTICEDKSASFDASAASGSIFTWSNGQTSSIITTSSPGLYSATAVRGTCSYTDAVRLNVDLIPTFNLGSDRIICDYDSVLLNCSIINASYQWNSGETSPSIITKTQGDKILTVTRGMCSFTDTAYVTVKNAPLLDIGPNQIICQGQQATFTSNLTADSYSWNTSSTQAQTIGTQQGLYILTITSGPCVVRDTAYLQVDIPPVVNLGADYTVCNTLDTIIKSGVANASYIWNTGETSQDIRPSTAGIYWVSVTKGACTRADSIQIGIQQQHFVSLPTDTILCLGEQLVLSTNTNATNPQFSWNSGQSSAEITVVTTQNYVVTVSSGVCVNKDSIQVTFVNPPVVNLGPNAYPCQGDSLVLDATNSGATYIWNTGDIGPSIVVKTNGTYSVEARIGPCLAKDELIAVFHVPPVLDLGPDINLCEGEMSQLNATLPGVSSYVWNTGETGVKLNVRRSGMYTVQAIQGPCIIKDSVMVNVWPLPKVNLRDTILCPEDSVLLDASCDGCTYDWFDGRTTSKTWAQAGSHSTVKVTTANNCSVEKLVSVGVDLECWDELFVPNSFTPNNDKKNDVFRVVASNVTVTEVLIFDRWGKTVYVSSSHLEGWDGTIAGNQAKEDVYIWKINYKDRYGRSKSKKGHVSLLR